jgi:hypothetical protein
MLTHDVDRVDKYTVNEIKLKLKQLIISDSKGTKFIKRFMSLANTFIRYLKNENPYWNFEWMKDLEERHEINSTWYFLPIGQRHRDAYYSFNETRIKDLVTTLLTYGDEIGLHGTYQSRTNKEVMLDNLNSLKSLIGEFPISARQHWLSFKYPETLRILEAVGIQCDSSWGFSDHVGWRNSYCHPFHPYDLEKDCMMDIWELPLTVMDRTLLEYQRLSAEESVKKVIELIEMVIKYNGVFVLLWHNSFFDEEESPGVTHIYKSIIEFISAKNCVVLTPSSFFSNFVEKA